MNPAIDRSEDLMGQSGWGIEKFGNGMGSNEAIGSVNSSAVAKSTGTLQKTAFDSGSYLDLPTLERQRSGGLATCPVDTFLGGCPAAGKSRADDGSGGNWVGGTGV